MRFETSVSTLLAMCVVNERLLRFGFARWVFFIPVRSHLTNYPHPVLCHGTIQYLLYHWVASMESGWKPRPWAVPLESHYIIGRQACLRRQT